MLEQVVSATDGHDLTGKKTTAAPDDWPDTHEWDETACAFVPGRFIHARRTAKAEINRRAEDIYAQHAKGGVIGMILEPAKFAEAAAYLTADKPAKQDYPLLQAEVGMTGATLKDVARVIEAKPLKAKAALKAVSIMVEPARIAACKAVDGAISQQEIRQILKELTFPGV